jgi:apolipoprotein N-acyltransferase
VTRGRLWLLIVSGAIALTASYPPLPLPFLSFLAITPAVLLVRQAVTLGNARSAFRWGWWYGLITNALVLYWMIVALWHFTPFSALGYLATIAIIGLLTGVMFWFVVRLRSLRCRCGPCCLSPGPCSSGRSDISETFGFPGSGLARRSRMRGCSCNGPISRERAG